MSNTRAIDRFEDLARKPAPQPRPTTGVAITFNTSSQPIARGQPHMAIEVNDKRSEVSVNRDSVLAKLTGLGTIVHAQKTNNVIVQPVIPTPSNVPLFNPPAMVPNIQFEIAKNMPEQPTMVEPTTTIVAPTTVAPTVTVAPTMVDTVEPITTTVAPTMIEPTATTFAPTATVVAPTTTVAPTATVVAPTKTRAPVTRRVRTKITDKTVAKVDLETAIINGRPIADRLPKPAPIVMKAPSYYMQNRKLYMQKLNALFADYNKEINEDNRNVSCDNRGKSSAETELMTHQRVIRDYLNLYTPYRGLLLYHGLGAGKTASSISIAEGMKSEKRVFVLTPASLKMNYFSELKKYGDPLFRKNQYWEFVSVEGKPDYVDVLSTALSLPREFIIANKGAWLVDVKQTVSNFKDLNANEQHMLDEQLNHMIRTKYVDINYNGLNDNKMTELTKNNTINPFDNSVVIVDEAHNLVSRIVNKLGKDTIADRLYKYLLSATNAKVVLLSGTPIINYPSELGVLFNILRGYINTWTFRVSPPAGFKNEMITDMFDKANFRNYDYIDYTNNVLTVTRNPFGFVYMKKSGVDKGTKRVPGNKEMIDKLDVDKMNAPTKVVQKKRVVFDTKAVDVEPTSTLASTAMNLFTNAFSAKPDNSAVAPASPDYPPPSTVADNSAVAPASPDYPPPSTSMVAPIQMSVGKATTETTKPVVKRLNTRKLTIKKTPFATSSVQAPPEQPPTSGGAGGKRTRKNKSTNENERENDENPYYHVENGIIVTNSPKPDIPDEINETVEKEILYQMELDQNNAGPDTMMRGGVDVVFDKYNGVHLNEQGNISDDDFVAQIKKILRNNGFTVNDTVEVQHYKALPDERDAFDAMFIDTTLSMKDTDLFKKRILGLTSYFRSAQESLLPRMVPAEDGSIYHMERCPMSENQISVYQTYRTKEREEELRASKNKNKNKDKEDAQVDSSYRVYSRAVCNFSFPTSIPRPEPPKQDMDNENKNREAIIDNLAQEIDDQPELADDQALTSLETSYAQNIQKALNALNTTKELQTENGEQRELTVLNKEVLPKYSPKFRRILDNISDEQNKGLHLVYSNFRTMEGIGILKMVLEQNGFAEFKLVKKEKSWEIAKTGGDPATPRFVLYTGTETAEEREMIRNIYNSNWDLIPPELAEQLRQRNANNYYGEIIKVIMITASGAEGINLENTRFVHIVEPYWHMTRVEQVVGRARRICSHKHLPEELRTVKVYMYLTVFSEPQKNSGDYIQMMANDLNTKHEPETTDEHLLEKAQLKDMLQKQFLKAIKETAIDCSLYNKSNASENLVCYGLGQVTSNDFSAYPTLDTDRRNRGDINVKEKEIKMKKIELPQNSGTFYAYDPSSGNLYDFEAYQNGNFVVSAKLEKRDGKMLFTKV